MEQPGKPDRGEELEKIKTVLRTGFEKLIVHGDYDFDEEGEVRLKLRADLDAKTGTYLMSLAGINWRVTEFRHKGQWVPGAVHIDTGQREKLTLEDDGSIFFDHHGEEEGGPTSATKITYETLVRLGLLRKEEWLDRLTAFVTEVDNLSYPLDESFFRKQWWQTLYGTHKVLPFGVIVEFFKQGRDPRKPFGLEYSTTTIIGQSPETGKPVTLKDAVDQTRSLVIKSIQNIDKAAKKTKKASLPETTPELGKVVLNLIEKGKKNNIPLGFTAAKALGYDTYLLWSGDHKSFFISSQTKDLAPVYERVRAQTPGAKLIRGTMILLPPTEAPGNTSLETVLQALGIEGYNKEAIMEGAPKQPMTQKEETPRPKPVEVPKVTGEERREGPRSLSELREALQESFAEGKISEKDFENRKAVLDRIAGAESPAEELKLAAAEGAITEKEYEAIKGLVEKPTETPEATAEPQPETPPTAETPTEGTPAEKPKETPPEPPKPEKPRVKIIKEPVFKTNKEAKNILKRLKYLEARPIKTGAEEKEQKELKEKEAAASAKLEEKKLHKDLKRLEGLAIRTAAEEKDLKETREKLALLEKEVEIELGALDEVKKEKWKTFGETAEAVLGKDVKLETPEDVEKFTETLLEEYFKRAPGFKNLYDKNPEELRKIKAEAFEIAKIEDPEKREKAKEKFFKEAGYKEGELRKEIASELIDAASVLMENLREGKKPSAEDKEKAKEAAKKGEKFKEGLKSLGGTAGLFGLALVIGFLLILLLELKIVDQMTKKK